MLKKEDERSIHPRVENGRTVYEKRNTCKPSRKDTKVMRRVNARLDGRVKEHKLTINRVPTRFKAGYTMPGSRNPNRCR